MHSTQESSFQRKHDTQQLGESIVEVLNEFRHILMGQQIVEHIDRENLTYKALNSERVMHWRLYIELYIEEYMPDFGYTKG